VGLSSSFAMTALLGLDVGCREQERCCKVEKEE